MNKQTDKKTALIDLELLLFSHAAKSESVGTSLKSCVEMLEFSIASIISRTHASDYYLVVSGPQNFRKVLYPDYKANRPPKPALYNPLYDACKELNQGKWVMHPQVEADDLLGVIATNGRVENPIICTIDKDLNTVPGWKFNWNKDDWPGFVSQEEADYNWLVQLLMGDSCDGIEGMKGIGEVKAKKLADDYTKVVGRADTLPIHAAKFIYGKEGFSLDAWRKSVELISIWRKPMPQELLENELIEQIVKTFPSL